VVVPARDEEERVGACLDALAAQVAIEPPEYEVLLVLDACTDETAERVRAAAARHFELRLYLLDGPGRGSGPARALGMNTACERLHAAGRPSGLIASTDADSRVAPDWLSAQLAAAERGARAIGGRIELCARERELLPPRVVEGHAERGRGRHLQVLADPREGPYAEHWQFSGASMAVTACAYAAVGGLPAGPDLEDERLEQALRTHGVTIERSLAVRVTTSARTDGRATRGLARDLAEAWGLVSEGRSAATRREPGEITVEHQRDADLSGVGTAPRSRSR